MNITANDAEDLVNAIIALENIKILSDMDREDFEEVIRDYLDCITLKPQQEE